MNTSHIKIFIVSIMLLLSGGCLHDTTTESPTATCTGFYSPTLSVSVLDSLTMLPITDATVLLQITGADSVSSKVLSWNLDHSSYYTDVSDENVGSGSFTVVASKDAYHTSVVRNISFEVNSSCGARNDWTITLYACPETSACM
jgi:hypothetical protein